MNILYATDDKFVPIMGVSITSLFESNKDMGEINVYVLGIDICKENENKLQNLAEQYERQIVFIDASEIDVYLDNVGAREWGGGRAAWYRCFVGRILPDEVNTVLYLDCDTIIVDTLAELTQTKLESGKALAMAADRVEGGGNNKCLGLSENDPYYQSGVILYDMKLWREIECEEKLLPIIGKYGKDLPFVDQCAINCALHSLVQTLPMRYNLATYNIHLYQDNCSSDTAEVDVRMQDSVRDAMRAPVIIHYANPSIYRPWHKDCKGAYMKEWQGYKDTSPWRDEPLWKDEPLRDGDSVKVHRQKSRLKDFCRQVMRFINPKIEEILWKKIAEPFRCTFFCTRNMPCAVKRGQT